MFCEIMDYKGKLCIPNTPKIKDKILKDAHNIPIVGHLRYHKTYITIRKSFFWSKMKPDIRLYVQKCLLCQKVKVEQCRTPRLLQLLYVSRCKWESMSMDFIIDLPQNLRGHDTILVLVDRLTKMAHISFPLKSSPLGKT